MEILYLTSLRFPFLVENQRGKLHFSFSWSWLLTWEAVSWKILGGFPFSFTTDRWQNQGKNPLVVDGPGDFPLIFAIASGNKTGGKYPWLHGEGWYWDWVESWCGWGVFQFLFFSFLFFILYCFLHLLICFKSSYRYNAHFTRYWTSNGETNDFCHKRISGAGVWKVWDLGYWKSKVRDSIVTNFKDSRFLVQLTQLKKINMKATLEYVNSMLTGEWKIAY